MPDPSWPLLPGVAGDAMFCGDDHRLWLSRSWGEPDAPFALHIGMNPSKAGRDNDDLTVRKDQEFTKRLGLMRMVKCNVGTLTWDQVDLQGANCRLWADQTKGREERVVPLTLAAVVALAGLPERAGHVFRSRYRDEAGERLPYQQSEYGAGGQFEKALKAACRAAGVPEIGAHVFRHSWGYAVATAWNAEPITLLTWKKSGLGAGRFRCNTEHILVARVGPRAGNPFG